MAWTLDKNRPICPQICEQLSFEIASGNYKPGERIPSVREIALEAGVNPNTVQKALAILSEQGLIYSMRGSGMFVNDNSDKASQKIEELKQIKTAKYLEEMKLLGMSVEQTQKYVEEWKE